MRVFKNIESGRLYQLENKQELVRFFENRNPMDFVEVVLRTNGKEYRFDDRKAIRSNATDQ